MKSNKNGAGTTQVSSNILGFNHNTLLATLLEYQNFNERGVTPPYRGINISLAPLRQ